MNLPGLSKIANCVRNETNCDIEEGVDDFEARPKLSEKSGQVSNFESMGENLSRFNLKLHNVMSPSKRYDSEICCQNNSPPI